MDSETHARIDAMRAVQLAQHIILSGLVAQSATSAPDWREKLTVMRESVERVIPTLDMPPEQSNDVIREAMKLYISEFFDSTFSSLSFFESRKR